MTSVISNYNVLILPQEEWGAVGGFRAGADIIWLPKETLPACWEKALGEGTEWEKTSLETLTPSLPIFIMSGVFLTFCFKTQREFQTKSDSGHLPAATSPEPTRSGVDAVPTNPHVPLSFPHLGKWQGSVHLESEPKVSPREPTFVNTLSLLSGKYQRVVMPLPIPAIM